MQMTRFSVNSDDKVFHIADGDFFVISDGEIFR